MTNDLSRDNPKTIYEQCTPLILSYLKLAEGHLTNVVTDGRLFQTVVVDPGWEKLPTPVRWIGREQLKWDEVMQELRKVAYSQVDQKIQLREDAEKRILAYLDESFGVQQPQAQPSGPNKATAIPQPPAAVRPNAAPQPPATPQAGSPVRPTPTPQPRNPVPPKAVPQVPPTAPAVRPRRVPPPSPNQPPAVPAMPATPAAPTAPTARATPTGSVAPDTPPSPAQHSVPRTRPAVAVAPVQSLPQSGPAEPVSSSSGPLEKVLGIDLGTTYSVLASVDEEGRPFTIHNSNGDLTTPSVILLDEGGAVVGKEALLAGPCEPELVASCVKRDMGSPHFRKRVRGEFIPPEVLSSVILKALREDAERRLGAVKKAVITVPAFFDEVRRAATVDAGRLAGLEVVDILNEPTAAAIAYGYQLGFVLGMDQLNKPVRVLVYDLGGGTYDVTIVEIHGNSLKAIATDGDVQLGGKDWDEKIVTLAAEQLRTELREDVRDNPQTLEEMWIAAENVKRTLSERTKATMYIHHLGTRHKVEITRTAFEEATASLVGRTRTTTEIVVRQAGLTWADIDRVLIVGGSTRMPMITRMLEELTGKVPERSVSPDEAIAHGAALYSNLIVNGKKAATKASQFAVTNVNSHSLGIVGTDPSTGRKRNQILIPKNTPLPHSIKGTFKTSKAGQSSVVIRIVEGESERPEACTQLGICKISPLPPNLPAGWPVYVLYQYLANGQLKVSAQVKGQTGVASTMIDRENKMKLEDMALWSQFVNSGAKAIRDT
ncbi:MAG: Hsp70 family protein [Gemmataceae bacterium]